MLTQEQKNTFREIWEQHFGQKLSDEEADAQGSRLVRIVRLICEPTSAGKDIKAWDGNLNKNNKS